MLDIHFGTGAGAGAGAGAIITWIMLPISTDLGPLFLYIQFLPPLVYNI